MAEIKSKLISDIELRVTGGKPSDDLGLPRKQISYWLDIVRDSLVANFLNDLIKRGLDVPIEYLEKETISLTSSGKGTLSKTPLAIRDDMGVVRVIDNEGRQLKKVSLHNEDWLSDLKYCKPVSDNLSYKRENQSIYVLGKDEYELSYDTVTVYYVSKYLGSGIEDSDEFKIDPILQDVLLEEVEQLAMREVYGTAQDLENDGEQDLNVQQPKK